MSQNVDIGLSFCVIVCRKNTKKTQKLPVFCHKIKTKAYTKNLRHPSLDQNVLYTHEKVGKNNWNTKRDICVKKIKVKILVINSPLPKYKDFRHVYYIIKWGKIQAIFLGIVCPSTLFRPREIALFLIWQLTTGVYP